MLAQVYRIDSAWSGIFYILLREDDQSLTMSLNTVNRVKNGTKEVPNYIDVDAHTLFLDDDKEISLLDTLPVDDALGFIKMYTMITGEK